MTDEEYTPEMNMTPPDAQSARDAVLWDRYQEDCKKDGTRATLDGYLIWLDDHDED